VSEIAEHDLVGHLAGLRKQLHDATLPHDKLAYKVQQAKKNYEVASPVEKLKLQPQLSADQGELDLLTMEQDTAQKALDNFMRSDDARRVYTLLKAECYQHESQIDLKFKELVSVLKATMRSCQTFMEHSQMRARADENFGVQGDSSVDFEHFTVRRNQNEAESIRQILHDLIIRY
jgi:hypothetical protein